MSPPPTASGKTGKTYGEGVIPSKLTGKLDVSKPATMAPTIKLLAVSTGEIYLAALAQGESSRLAAEGGSTITSLAPDVPGVYRDLILRGEKAFRNEKYRDAASSFELAKDLSINSPETLLSLMHTHLAASQDSYNLASFYLQETLRKFPELPLTPVHPKSFYAQGANYIRDLVRLEKYAKSQPEDPHGLFILAYLRWRDDQAEEARNLLSQALAQSNTDDLAEAIEALWDGMVASGKASGELTLPEEKPAAGSPHSAPAEPQDQAPKKQ